METLEIQLGRTVVELEGQLENCRELLREIVAAFSGWQKAGCTCPCCEALRKAREKVRGDE